MNATEVISSPSRNIKTAATDANHFILTFENNRLASELFGQFDQHLKLLEQRLQIEARARGNSVSIAGELMATVGGVLVVPVVPFWIWICRLVVAVAPAELYATALTVYVPFG